MPGEGNCKACGANMIWLKTKSDKNIPIDAASYEPGDKIFDRDKHQCHFDTCPNADKFRKGPKKEYKPAARGGAGPSHAKPEPEIVPEVNLDADDPGDLPLF